MNNDERERRLRWLVFGGVVAALAVMLVVFVVVGNLAR
jgi:putative Ca2+/H+ antiporter (TMEM165/GDT1 family)